MGKDTGKQDTGPPGTPTQMEGTPPGADKWPDGRGRHRLQPPLGKLIKPSISTVLPLSATKGGHSGPQLPCPSQELITYPVMNSAENPQKHLLSSTCLCSSFLPTGSWDWCGMATLLPLGIPVSFTTHRKERFRRLACQV